MNYTETIIASLKIMGVGMICIFTVIILIMLIVVLLKKILKDK